MISTLISANLEIREQEPVVVGRCWLNKVGSTSFEKSTASAGGAEFVSKVAGASRVNEGGETRGGDGGREEDVVVTIVVDRLGE